MESGISTLGITFGYGMETTAGVKPTVFTQLHRINSIGGITIESEQIDASALEDLVSRYIQGRGDTGGTFPVGVNYTSETLDEWEGVISAYNAAKGTGKRMWFETIIPGFSKSEFVVAQPPAKIPSPEKNQNELLIVEMNLRNGDNGAFYNGRCAAVMEKGAASIPPHFCQMVLERER